MNNQVKHMCLIITLILYNWFSKKLDSKNGTMLMDTLALVIFH